MIRLVDLEPRFLRYEPVGAQVYHRKVDTLAEAHGVMFLCPRCFVDNNGPVGTHRVICWFMGRVPDEAIPGPGRWPPIGTGLHDLTLGPGPNGMSSVLLSGGCKWHGYVRQGDVTFA